MGLTTISHEKPKEKLIKSYHNSIKLKIRKGIKRKMLKFDL